MGKVRKMSEKNKRKRVTMADVAGKLGISKNAVSLALAGKPGVSEQMRRTIAETARKMGYYAPGSASNAQACIVVLVPPYIRDDGSFYSDVFWAIEHESRKTSVVTITAGLSAQAQRELTLPNVPEGLRIIGYLAIGSIDPRYLNRLVETGKKVVSVDIRTPMPISSVSADNFFAGKAAAEYLISKGHRSIGFAGPAFGVQSVYERWCGFSRALMDHGILPNEDMCILGRRDGFELLDTPEALSRYYVSLRQRPTAWFCAGDLIALSMCRLLNASGLHVPDDVSVMGCDDLKMGEYIRPALTTMHIDRKLMGKRAVWLLLGEKNEHPDDVIHIMLPVPLVERQSVKTLLA